MIGQFGLAVIGEFPSGNSIRIARPHASTAHVFIQLAAIFNFRRDLGLGVIDGFTTRLTVHQVIEIADIIAGIGTDRLGIRAILVLEFTPPVFSLKRGADALRAQAIWAHDAAGHWLIRIENPHAGAPVVTHDPVNVALAVVLDAAQFPDSVEKRWRLGQRLARACDILQGIGVGLVG